MAMSLTKRTDLHTFIDSLPPLPEQSASANFDTPIGALPGYADIAIDNSPLLSKFLLKDLECQDLDQMSDHLWMMTEQRSANISPIHRQKVKGREIVVTEEPKLHLIWFYDKIYIKPMPRYLLSQEFWRRLLEYDEHSGPTGNLLRASALGFVRSYAYLVEYESDFRMAQSQSLLPGSGSIKWNKWRVLRSKLLAIRDREVSARFKFGEIRLTRLNLYSKLLLQKPYYHRTYRQYGEYFASFYPPLLFLFGIVSVILGAMQLAATIEQYDAHWRGLVSLYRASSLFFIIATSLILLALIAIFLYKIVREWMFALRCRYEKSKLSARKNSKP